MSIASPRRALSSVLVLSLVLPSAGCPAKGDDPLTASTTTDAADTVATSTAAPGDSSGAVGSTASGDDASSTGPDDDGTTGPAGAPNGTSCTGHSECASGKCFYIPLLGGLCSECLEDADCEGGGCTIPNPSPVPPIPARCNEGELGQGCMTDEVCQEGLVCAVILDIPAIITASTCSECVTDADCGDDLCAPQYDVMNASGQRVCVAPGQVPNGEGCDLAESGDLECASGICAPADINNGVWEVGVCGECRTDADCEPRQTCQEATGDTQTGVVTGTTCTGP